MSARAVLHHERLGGDAATATVLFTHGIYGSGANWRTIARQVVAARPDLAAVLVDLRLHGRSSAGAPPHTVAACTADVAALVAQLDAAGPPVVGAVGHSFGGKVILGLERLSYRVVLDSTPSARPDAWARPTNTVRLVWESLVAVGPRHARREDFVAALVGRGHPRPLAQWLAMNLRPDGDHLVMGLDLPAVRDLLVDYYAVDLWPALEQPTGAVAMIVAEHGGTVSAADLARLEHAPAAVVTHVIPGASHWLHLDAGAEVVAQITAALAARP